MKNVKNALAIVCAFAIVAVFVSSCSQEEEVAPTSNNSQLAITDDVMAKFGELGFDVGDIDVTGKTEMLDPAYEAGNYLLEGDIVITPENLAQMLNSSVYYKGPVGEQYRTNNLVGGLPRTIRVMGYTGGSNALDNTMRTALQWAIDNYNALNTNLNFTLTFGTNYSSYDIVVYRVSGGGGGQAGFPSGGNPYKFVQIQSGTSSYGTNVVEHVITHEIGHCLGLRHTDYFNRSLSCGSGGNEGDGGVGAIHIPGTPTGFDANSIMLSCFSSGEDGEFGNYDRVALEYLY
ncbi:zinc-dependent metalloprotease [Fulvivirga ulvae]|uniref:M57 family metalloprotease n=1 Tax=Fulvivirga ulvae TaxID=2904245 RepID=UPI001F2EF38C|nr:M57 family metalloprotease [Fulvivirga ulvae]UII32091.1 zinc-dependent metalloprotease [Fulvivirga ulvae]